MPSRRKSRSSFHAASPACRICDTASSRARKSPAVRSARRLHPKGQDFQYTLNLQRPPRRCRRIRGTLSSRSIPANGGQITRIRDIGRVELGAQTYSETFNLDGKPAAGIGIFLLPDANAIAVADGGQGEDGELAKSFPQGLTYLTPLRHHEIRGALRSTRSIETLFEAFGLVLIVILLFLQDWRAMLVPVTTVPVTIIGAFAAMAALGFSINLATMFAIVLAIGIVVDDAIVIVEGISRYVEQA